MARLVIRLATGSNYLSGFSILSRTSSLTFFPELNTSGIEAISPAAAVEGFLAPVGEMF